MDESPPTSSPLCQDTEDSLPVSEGMAMPESITVTTPPPFELRESQDVDVTSSSPGLTVQTQDFECSPCQPAGVSEIIPEAPEPQTKSDSCAGDETKITEITTVEVSTCTTPSQPHLLVEAGCSPHYYTDLKETMATMTTPTLRQRTDKDQGTSPVPIKTQTEDTAVCTSPIPGCDAQTSPHLPHGYQRMSSTMTTPTLKRFAETNQGTSPLRIPAEDMGTNTSPVSSSDAQTSPHRLPDVAACTMTTPTLQRYREKDQGTSPLRVAVEECGTCTTPVAVPQYRDTETSPHPVGDFYSAASTMTTPTLRGLWETSQGTSPILVPTMDTASSPHVEMPTSPSITNMGTTTTPLTTPRVHFADDNGTTAGRLSQLVSDLEVASISNELLRKEVESLNQQKSSQLASISTLKEEKAELDKRIQEAVKHTKDAMQSNMDDLMSQLGEQLNQIGMLESKIKEKNEEVLGLQAEHAKTEDKYKKEIQDMEAEVKKYEKEVQNLQGDLRRIYKQHKQEVSSLKEEYNHRSAYIQACKKNDELKAALDVYKQESKSFIKYRDALASESAGLKTCFTNLKTVKASLEEKHLSLAEKEQNLIHKQDELEKQEKELETAREQCRQELQTMQEKTATALHEKKLMQINYDDCLNQLQESTAEIAGIVSELNVLKEECDSLKEELEKQRKENEDLQETNQNYSLEMQVMQTSVQVQDHETQLAREKAETAEEKLKTMNNLIEIEFKRFEEEMESVTNQLSSLQCTLQDKEHTIERQNMELEKYKGIQEKCSSLQEQIETLQTQYKENQEFMEEERGMLAESLKEAEEKLKVDNLELSRQRVKVFEKTEECNQLTSTVEQLGVQLHDVQSELDSTKAQAQWMLYRQGNEINSASDEIMALKTAMDKMMAALQQKLGCDKKITAKLPSIEQSSVTNKSQDSAASLVSSVLDAVRKTLVTDSGDAPDTSGAPTLSDRRLTIGDSSGSAFQPVQVASNQKAEGESCEDESGPVIGESDVTLGDQVCEVKDALTEMWQMIKVLEGAGHKTIQELTDKVEQLTKNTERLQGRYGNDLDLVRDQLRQSEAREKRLHEELKTKRNELHESEQSLEYSKVKINEMADNLGRFSDQKSNLQRFTKQIEKLTSECQLLSRDKDVLQQELEEALHRVEELTQEKGMDSKETLYIREKMMLKREVEKLKLQSLEKDEYYQSMNSRASRQTKILEENWKKAEEEVYKLDEMLELVRQTLEEVPEVIKDCNPLNRLLEELCPKD
ncbi:myosin-3-like [Ptychodera flava]|uniref:myosin-3-like n=1 Tax=Ptychodera flava TaxID=63121 RepID=UPI00396A6022